MVKTRLFSLAIPLTLLCILARPAHAQDDSWSLTGNANTNPATNFLGTTDNQPIVFRANGSEVMRVDRSGNVGIGYVSPSEKLMVRGNILSSGGFVGGNGGLSFIRDLGDGSGGALLSNIGSVDIIIDSDNNNTNRTFRIMANGTDRRTASTLLLIDEFGNTRVNRLSTSETARFGGDTVFAKAARFDDEVHFGRHVGIGVSAGESTLHVRESSGEDATIRLSSGGSWPLIIRQNSASNFAIENGGYKRFAITSQGVEINNAREMPTIRFRGDAGNSEGYIEAYDGSGDRNFELRSQFSATQRAAWLSLNDAARERITLAARNGNTGVGGLIDVKNNSGDPTVRIAGDTGNGSGRVVTSVLEVTGGSDLAEPFQIAEENVEPGSVVVIDPANAGRLKLSSEAYDRKVAGIVSGAGGVNAGMLMGKSNAMTDSVQNVALTGRVYGWADATYGAIQPGDLLTTSDTPGHARRVDDYAKAQGAIIGKAMTALESGRGLVLVLVSLQ